MVDDSLQTKHTLKLSSHSILAWIPFLPDSSQVKDLLKKLKTDNCKVVTLGRGQSL